MSPSLSSQPTESINPWTLQCSTSFPQVSPFHHACVSSHPAALSGNSMTRDLCLAQALTCLDKKPLLLS